MEPNEIMESALFVLETGGDYKVAYDAFLGLYRTGELREDAMSALTQAFYEPNEEELRERYQENCALLTEYPYLFRKDFPAFEALPVRFFPYDDEGYLPFDRAGERFGDYFAPRRGVIGRNFFRDLDRPVLAADVYSQYELEYLRDNVRRSEDVARENHVYLHYTDWGDFCAYLQVLDMAPVLSEEKAVFLIGEEIEQYPIDFKARFGIDYAKCTPRPVGLREVTRLIWHSQLSTHNGGDFFNEVFDGHPNLAALPSVMLEGISEAMGMVRRAVETLSLKELKTVYRQFKLPGLLQELHELHETRELTDKDLMVACYLMETAADHTLDRRSRIAPAIFFQPHFKNIDVSIEPTGDGKAVMRVPAYEQLLAAPMVQGFKYIKTFTPMRRIATSYGASIRFMYETMDLHELVGTDFKDLPDKFAVNDASLSVYRMFNRTYMVDRADRLYTDSILVRFEDGKLNPKATFTALCAFLDLPYTRSMTYCSENGEEKQGVGFGTGPVFRPYILYAGGAEQWLFEFLFRDAYRQYGYDPIYYDGKPISQAQAEDAVSRFAVLEYHMRELRHRLYSEVKKAKGRPSPDELTAEEAKRIDDEILSHREMRIKAVKMFFPDLPTLVSPRGRILEMMPMLHLDEDLLEQPLYH